MGIILRSPGAQKKKKIALIFWPKVGNQHLHLIGIREFASGFSHWIWKGLAPVNSAIPAIRAWRPDGIIGMLETPELARACRRLRVPAVDVGDRLEHQPCTRVCVDHGKIGEMAVKYFLERRFQHFAFCGAAGAPVLRRRFTIKPFAPARAPRARRVPRAIGTRSSVAHRPKHRQGFHFGQARSWIFCL